MKRGGGIVWLALALPACGPSPEEVLRAQLSQAIQTRPSDIRLAEYVRTGWDRVCIVMPYTPESEIARLLGFAWSGAGRTGIAASDAHTLLLFVRGRGVSEAVMLERRAADFAAAGGSYCLTRGDAVFRAEAGATGTRLLPAGPTN